MKGSGAMNGSGEGRQYAWRNNARNKELIASIKTAEEEIRSIQARRDDQREELRERTAEAFAVCDNTVYPLSREPYVVPNHVGRYTLHLMGYEEGRPRILLQEDRHTGSISIEIGGKIVFYYPRVGFEAQAIHLHFFADRRAILRHFKEEWGSWRPKGWSRDEDG